jgi:hypothetical protein
MSLILNLLFEGFYDDCFEEIEVMNASHGFNCGDKTRQSFLIKTNRLIIF